MTALFNIVQGVISTIMTTIGFGTAEKTVLTDEIKTAVADCVFLKAYPYGQSH